MDIISLELNRRGPDESESDPSIKLIEQLQALICGIGQQAVDGGEGELSLFQQRTREIADSLNSEFSADDLLVAVGRTLRLTEDYNRRATVIFKGEVEELRAMLLTMTETVQFIISSSETSVKQLTFMESQLQRANTLEDMRQLKMYATACLTLVRRENVRLQNETRERIDTLKTDVERLTIRLKVRPSEESHDPVTGLPDRGTAEQAIEAKLAAGEEFVTALFVVEGLAAINGRFGHAAGNGLIVDCARMVAKRLSGVTLYRWSGPAFVAIFESLAGSAEAEGRAREAAAQQLKKSIAANQQMVMIVASISCHILRILPRQMSPTTIFKTMDGFVAAKVEVREDQARSLTLPTLLQH